MRKMAWNGDIYSDEAKKAQQFLNDETDCAQKTPSPAERSAKTAGRAQPQSGTRRAPVQPAQTAHKPETAAVQSGFAQPSVPKPEHKVIRVAGSAQQVKAQEAALTNPQPAPKPTHKVIRTASNEAQPTQTHTQKQTGLPPSVQKGSDLEKIPQPMSSGSGTVCVDVRSYRRPRSSRIFGGDELFSPVNIIGALITAAMLVAVVLNWQMVTAKLAYGVLYVAVNLSGIVLLIIGIIVMIMLIGGRRGRGLFRRMFR